VHPATTAGGTGPLTPGRRRKLAAFLPLAVDVVVPTALYFVLTELGASPVWALSVAGAATAVSTLVTTVRRGRLDGVGMLVVVEIAISLALLLVTADPRFLLLKPSIYTLITAGYLYLTCVVGRPVGYEAATPMATGGDPQRLAAYREAWVCSAPFRRRERLVTAAFGTALLLEAVLRAVVVFALPPEDIGTALTVGQLPGIVLVVAALLVARAQAPALSRIVDEVQERLGAPAAR
jgi:hypothetical protein